MGNFLISNSLILFELFREVFPLKIRVSTFHTQNTVQDNFDKTGQLPDYLISTFDNFLYENTKIYS